MNPKLVQKYRRLLKQIYLKADQVCKKNPHADRETVVQTLFAVKKSPAERLRSALTRAQKIPF